jgi:hypothetical protein
MFEWLNHNAAAVQALASVFSVIATVVLLRITRQYVGLTQELARAAREQLRFQQRTVASEAAQLLTLIDVFLGSLRKFPVEKAQAETLRTVSMWKHADISTFGSLAASVLGQRQEVQRAIQRLNWLRGAAERAQSSESEAGLTDFPWSDWKRQIDEARTALEAVRGDAQSVDATPMDSAETDAAEPQRSVSTPSPISPDNTK